MLYNHYLGTSTIFVSTGGTTAFGFLQEAQSPSLSPQEHPTSLLHLLHFAIVGYFYG